MAAGTTTPTIPMTLSEALALLILDSAEAVDTLVAEELREAGKAFSDCRPNFFLLYLNNGIRSNSN